MVALAKEDQHKLRSLNDVPLNPRQSVQSAALRVKIAPLAGLLFSSFAFSGGE
jgi:hypothetical protein